MPAIIKSVVKGFSLLLLLLMIGIAALLLIIDPNDYRTDIENHAKKHAGLNLKVGGEISWSLLPFGINVNQISIVDQNQKPFSAFNNLTLQIDTLSLLQLSPKVNTLLLDGLDIELIKNKDGKANWANLIANKDATTKEPESIERKAAKGDSNTQLNFLVEQVEISNARLSYLDQQNSQELEISNLALSMQDITLDQAFPISIRYQIKNKTPETKITQNLTGMLTISSDYQNIAINSLNSAIALTSELIHGKTVDAQIGGDIEVNMASEQIALNNMVIGVANLKTNAQLKVSNYSTQAEVLGKISLNDFALPELLSKLGQSNIPTRNPDALSKLAFSSGIKLTGDDLSLPALKIKVDQSNWEGSLDFNLKTQALALNLQGDEFIIDGYLPPESNAEPKIQPKEIETKQTGDEPLLPLETIRALNLAVKIKQQAIVAKDMRFKDLNIEISAKDGVVKLKHANTKLYDGQIDTTASLNAKTDTILWDFNADVNKLNILEHIGGTELMGYQLGGAGNINLTTTFNSQGNNINTLQKFAKAEANLKVVDGAITGINLNKMACDGFAFLNGEKVTKSDWPNETKFNALEADVNFDGSIIKSKNLTIENIGLRAKGQGTIDLAKRQLIYELDLTPMGELGDEACRVREKIKGIAIPIKCEGALDTPPASLCGLNYKKLGRTAEKLAKKEAKRKVEKEVDRAIDKKLDKYLDKDSELGKSLKKGLKGLFK